MVNKTPKHIAIIMDGNRRWAKRHRKPFYVGHQKGVDSLRRAVHHCGVLGVSYLTVYAFSTENKSRSRVEVNALFSILSDALRGEVPELNKNNVKLNFMGDIGELPKRLQKGIKESEAYLSGNTGLNLVIALNYGGRAEIVKAVKLAKNITEDEISKNLYLPNLPEPDLIIRTGGVYRLSNFMLWQAAYSELYFTETLWPDFNEKDLEKAILDYNGRERRFGK